MELDLESYAQDGFIIILYFLIAILMIILLSFKVALSTLIFLFFFHFCLVEK